MSDGRQAALASTMIGPSRQASHRPVVSVRQAVDRTTSRQRTFSGTPRTVSRMLVPHDVASSRAVACTCEVRLVPDSVTGAAGCPPGCAGGDAPQGPVIKTAAAAREAASPAADPASRARGQRPARRARSQRRARRPGLIRCALRDRAARKAAADRHRLGHRRRRERARPPARQPRLDPRHSRPLRPAAHRVLLQTGRRSHPQGWRTRTRRPHLGPDARTDRGPAVTGSPSWVLAGGALARS